MHLSSPDKTEPCKILFLQKMSDPCAVGTNLIDKSEKPLPSPDYLEHHCTLKAQKPWKGEGQEITHEKIQTCASLTASSVPRACETASQVSETPHTNSYCLSCLPALYHARGVSCCLQGSRRVKVLGGAAVLSSQTRGVTGCGVCACSLETLHAVLLPRCVRANSSRIGVETAESVVIP